MSRRTALFVGASMMVGVTSAQSYGLLLSAGRSQLYAAGQAFQPANGLSAGVFLPFYVNDRIVVRAELGLGAQRTRPSDSEGASGETRTEAFVNAIGRFYLSRKVSLSLGVQGLFAVQAPDSLVHGGKRYGPSPMDAVLLMGAAYRWTNRIETGLRLGQGLLPAVDLPAYGTAHRRSAQITLSYLLHNTRAGFAKRRKWRSGLAMTHCY